MDEPWWKSAVVYQIYPRSFCDTTGDGIGDLPGIRRHLDHLEWLGIDAIWLSPFFTSPMADFGYDVADYCDVDPRFGTLDDFDALLADAHGRGIKVLIDWVPNHSSDRHPWFVEARASRDSPKRDWYVWRDPDSDDLAKPPNDLIAAFTGESAWEWDATTGQWYFHRFLPQQPDLNWRNPEVVAAMHATLRFWLDRGVDGFRMDVIHMIGSDPEMAPGAGDDSYTHECIRDIRRVLDSYEGRVSVGEVFLLSTAAVARYYGADGDELHLAFNFPPLFAPWEAAAWRKRIQRVQEELDPLGAWPTWVLSNHDVKRHRTRYGSEARARAAAVLLVTLRGTPFLYAGEELGLEDAIIPAERVVDPGGRDGCRAPLPWEPERGHGWGVEDPWLPWPPDAARRSVAVLRREADSILYLYRRLLAARRGSPALQLGGWRELPAPAEAALAYERLTDDDRRVVLVNFTEAAVVAPVDGDWSVEVASDGTDEGAAYSGALRPDQAVVLRPR